MNRHTIPLGRILGIPIGLDYSWFLIFVLITWTMAVGYYPAEFKNLPVVQYWFMGAMTAIMLFVSVLLHELGIRWWRCAIRFRSAASRSIFSVGYP